MVSVFNQIQAEPGSDVMKTFYITALAAIVLPLLVYWLGDTLLQGFSVTARTTVAGLSAVFTVNLVALSYAMLAYRENQVDVKPPKEE